jgi:aryl-alcohol dehydrogenase-like predicted oxidoreductase
MKDIEYVKFTKGGSSASRIGFGCWAIGGHGWGAVYDEDSIRAIRHAFEMGINFFDTADCYGLGKSERILRRALSDNVKRAFIASKGGVRWDKSGVVWNDSSPTYIRSAVEQSLIRLGIEQIPLYYLHKLDNQTPLVETMKELAILRQEGKIGEIGVSNLNSKQLEVALTVAPICAVQVQFNLLNRSIGEKLSKICFRHNIRLVAWGALADGILTGKFDRGTTFGKNDHRSRLPDLQGERFIKNLERVESFRIIARAHDVSLAQLALRWVMDKYACACPIFGAKTASQVEENIDVFGWKLSIEEVSLLDSLSDK